MPRRKPLPRAKAVRRPCSFSKPGFSGRRFLDSLELQSKQLARGPYSIPQPIKPCRIREEPPSDMEGKKARKRKPTCQMLYTKSDPENIRRTDKEAWELVLSRIDDVVYAMRGAKVLYPSDRHGEHFFFLGIDAAFLAARTWDEKRGGFPNHLKKSLKSCWRAVKETRQMVHRPPGHHTIAKKYGDWKSTNPHGTLEDYAEEAGISMKDAERAACFYEGVRAAVRPVSADAHFSGGRNTADEDSAEKDSFVPSNPRKVGCDTPQNNLETKALIARRRAQEASASLPQAITEVLEGALRDGLLDEKEVQVLRLYFWEGLSVRQMEPITGFSRTWADKLKNRALRKLGRSRKYSPILRGMFETLNDDLAC